MPDNEGPLQFLVESAKKAILRGLFSDLLPRHIRQVVNSLFGDSCELKYSEGSHHPAVMEPIDISSSSDDSVFGDIDNYASEPHAIDSATSSKKRLLPSSFNAGGSNGSSQIVPLERLSNANGRSLNANPVNGRALPPWALPSSSNGGGSSGSSRMLRLEQSSNANGRSLNVNHVPARQQMHARSRSNGGPSHSFASGSDHTVYLIEDDDIDDELHSSKRPKRTPPSSSQPPFPSNRSNNFVENIGGSQFRDRQGISYQSSRPFSINGESNTRVLPQSLGPGKSSNSHAYGKASDPSQNWGIGEDRSAETDERLVFQAALQDINQPNTEANLPEGLLSVPLLRHQKIALAWMIKRETEGRNCLGGILADDQGLGKTVSMIAIIQMLKSLQEEFKSENLRNSKAEAFNLDDDDDGDKNESASDRQKKKTEVDDSKVVPEESSSNIRNKKPAAGTLVVCPASVLRQWNRELEDKVTEEAKLSVLIYHGGNRTKDASELAKYDVVLTTYAIVNNEAPKKPSADEENEQNNGDMYGLSSEFSFNKKPKKAPANKKGKKHKHVLEDDASDSDSGAIAKVRWFRVILDEAQTIKNHRTQVARACCSLRAKKRWCLSGTPIQNAIEELYSYFRFLKFDPYWRYKAFYEGIKLQISRDSAKGYAKLQVILRSLMLRRTKGTVIDGQPIISLPPKDIQLAKVEFSPEERSYYTDLEAKTRKQFKAYAAAGTVNQNYANILLMLLRLRQACDHPLLVEGVVGSKFAGRKGSMGIPKSLPKEKLVSLLNLLEASSAICYVCKDPPEDAVVSVCEHVFCFQCVSDYLTGEDNTCPVSRCKTQLNSDVLISENALKKCVYGDVTGDASSSSGVYERSSVLTNEYSSSKINALLEILQECYITNSSSEINAVALSTGNSSSGNQSPGSLTSKPIKAIVFSQWTGMLDLVEVSLKNTGLIYRRLDGGMSLAARDKAVKEFNLIPEVTVMLMSLKAGNLGLNMVAACRVILLDLWWNPTTEDQAIDRAHRIGQTRPVIVSRLTIKDSVEDRILALQAEKRKMVASAYGEDQSGKKSGTGLSMDDLKYLFGV